MAGKKATAAYWLDKHFLLRSHPPGTPVDIDLGPFNRTIPAFVNAHPSGQSTIHS